MTTTKAKDRAALGRVEDEHLNEHGYTAAEAQAVTELERTELEQLALSQIAEARKAQAELVRVKAELPMLQRMAKEAGGDPL